KIRFDSFITNSSSTSCGITRDKKLFCTENKNRNGSSFFEFSHPLNWPTKLVDSGRSHICAVFAGQTLDEVWCKGTGTSGQLGDGLKESSTSLVKVVGLPNTRIKDLGLGNSRSCALTKESNVYCWGSGGGVSSDVAAEMPFNDFVELKGNYSSTCGLKVDGSLWCWGSGGNGILGQGNATTYNTPVRVKDSLGTGYLENVSAFAVGQTHTCAIIDEEVYCWGLSIRIVLDADGYINLTRL